MDLILKPFNLKDRNIFIYNNISEEEAEKVNKTISDIIVSDNNVIDENKYVIEYLYKDSNIDYNKHIPEVNVYLETYGGSVYSGLNIYDSLKKLNSHCKTNIIVSGKCMSAGIIVLLSVPFEQRICTKSTTFMIHQVSTGFMGKTADLADEYKECKRLTDMIFDIIKNNTAITQEDLDNNYNTKTDWILTAEDALKLKLISKII